MPDMELLPNSNVLTQEKNHFYLVYFGVISGILSYFLHAYWIDSAERADNIGFSTSNLLGDFLIAWPWLNFFFRFLPGIVFGIFMSLYFLRGNRNSKAILKSIVWVITTGLAYCTANFVTSTAFVEIGGITVLRDLSFFAGGLTGAIITLVGFRFLITRLSILAIIRLTLLGGVLGLGWFIGNFFPYYTYVERLQGYNPSYFFLFTIWQVGMALGLQLAFKSKRTVENIPH